MTSSWPAHTGASIIYNCLPVLALNACLATGHRASTGRLRLIRCIIRGCLTINYEPTGDRDGGVLRGGAWRLRRISGDFPEGARAHGDRARARRTGVALSGAAGAFALGK